MHSDAFTLGDFALFVYYLGWISEFTKHFGRAPTAYKQAGVSIERMLTLLQGAPPPPRAIRPSLYARSPPELPALVSGEEDRLHTLQVTDLSYRYPETEHGIQHITSCSNVAPSLAITGRIGSGKTTLCRSYSASYPAITAKSSGTASVSTSLKVSSSLPKRLHSQVPHMFRR